MSVKRFSASIIAVLAYCSAARPQAVVPVPLVPSHPTPSQMIALSVPKGTGIQVALDKEVRVRGLGQPIHGRVVQALYAFDRIVIPVGAEVTGRISKIDGLPGKQRTLAILNADFTPARRIEIEFTDLVLPDGKHMPLRTAVTPGSGHVIQLVSAENEKTKKDIASEKMKAAKEKAKEDWQNAMNQVKEPGKVHRLEKYALGRLPVHPQFIDAGTLYFAELQDPLDFGSEVLTAKAASSIGSPPPPGSLVRALLVTPLNSATTKKGTEVEATLSQPLFDQERLILPQGSRLRGSVVQVEPARHMKHNGQLRIMFRELVPPEGVQQRVDASLEGVQAGKGDHVKLDSEGGAQATSPKSRYLSMGISLGLAAASAQSDADANAGGNAAGNTTNRMAGGATAFKLVGIALGVFVHSQSFGMGMGAYGASTSFYSHFLARGHDVIFPKDTQMEIGFGSRASTPLPPTTRDVSTR